MRRAQTLTEITCNPGTSSQGKTHRLLAPRRNVTHTDGHKLNVYALDSVAALVFNAVSSVLDREGARAYTGIVPRADGRRPMPNRTPTRPPGVEEGGCDVGR